MPREKGFSAEKIKEMADRAEGLIPDEADTGQGRPPKYKKTFAEQTAKLCLLGATNEDLADFFHVSIRTVIRWMTEHEEFCHAVKEAKDVADARVERSLYQRAVGYTFDSEKIFNGKDGIVRTDTREHVPPDVTAQIFWLKNRRKEQWRDKQEVETSGNLTINVVQRAGNKPTV